MTTKMSTVTPITKSTGSGVANMGKGKNKGKAPKEGFFKKAYNEVANEVSQYSSSMKMKKDDKKGLAKAMAIGAAAGASMPRFAMERTVTKKPTKAKAKMLPEVTVTAPKPKKRLALKVTSKRMR
jgi:hypothetical protein